MIRKSIIVTLKVEGVHAWKTCNIKEVDYLKYTHRHTFGFSCKKEVTHDDRDVEFIKFQHKIRNYLYDNYFSEEISCCDFTGQSCEMLAEELFEKFDLIECKVDEDNEFFGVVETIEKHVCYCGDGNVRRI